MAVADAGTDGPAEGLVTVRRTMLVLEMLAGADAGISLSDIAKELDVNKSTARRIVPTLGEFQFNISLAA